MPAGGYDWAGNQKTHKFPFPPTLSAQITDKTPYPIHTHEQHEAGNMEVDTLHAATYSQKMEVLVLERSRPAFSSLEILWVSYSFVSLARI